MSDAVLLKNPAERFQALCEAFLTRRRWYRRPQSTYFAAMIGLRHSGSPDHIAQQIHDGAEEIRSQAGWFESFGLDLRLNMAALLLVQGDSPAAFLAEVPRVREMFRREGLRRDRIFETLAIMVLRSFAENQPISAQAVNRLRATYDCMKSYHWWLTNPDDFPVCALLASLDPPVSVQGERVERMYQSLRGRRLRFGNTLHVAAALLSTASEAPDTAAARFRELADAFRAGGVRIFSSDYDELAVLTMTPGPVAKTVQRVIDLRAAMKSLRPRPDAWTSFNLASSLTFLESMSASGRRRSITDVKAMLDMLTVLKARRRAQASAGG